MENWPPFPPMQATCQTLNAPETVALTCSEQIVCACLQVTEAQLRRALRASNARSIQELKRKTGAGDGCTACHAALKQFIRERG